LVVQVNVRVGTSGFAYDHWREVFYPDELPKRQWLEFYAELFNAVEINSSFYHLPRENTLASWAQRTPPGFLFVLKGSRFVTHTKRLKNCADSVALFYERVQHLGNKLAAVLWQLPPGLKSDRDLLLRFLELLPANPGPVLEFRNASWFTEEVFQVMQERGVALCIHDMPASSCPDIMVGPLLYMRFHGPLGLYRGSYAPEYLAQAAKFARGLAEGRDLYAFFNNDFGGHAISNARQFRDCLCRRDGCACRSTG
jgi:uncharacterized protein YecE (DUF72 family)